MIILNGLLFSFKFEHSHTRIGLISIQLSLLPTQRELKGL